MIIECINCSKKFDVNSDLIPSTGRTIQCGSCNHVWFFNPNKANLKINEEIQPNISIPINNQEIEDIKPKKKTDQLNKTEKKKFEVTKYQAKSSLNITKFLSYILLLQTSSFRFYSNGQFSFWV